MNFSPFGEAYVDDADAVAQNTKKIADLQTNIKQWEAQIEREKQQIDAAHRNTERMYPNGYDHSLFNSFEAFQASQHKFIDGRSTYIANLRHNISEANEQIERLQLSNRILTTDTPESIKEREIQEGAYASSKIAAAQVKIDAETTATRKAIDKKVADATPAERTRLFGALIWEKLPAAERKTFNTLFSVTALATAAGMATALVAFRNYAIAKLPGRVAPHLMIAFTSYHVTRMQLAWINAMDATTSAELDKQATIFAESFTNLVGDLAVAGAAYGLSKLPTLARAIRTPYAAQTAAEIAEMAAAASKTYCFAEGTPLLTPDGSKSIENFKVGDAILSADENDCQCRVQLRHVEQIHRRSSLVMCLSLGGREIRLTQNHPIFTPDRGWVQAGELRIGDYVLGHDGKAVPIDGVEEDGRLRTVYNLTISGLHTFFVGGSDWGFSVWVHNLDCGEVWRALAGANAGEIPEEAGAVLRAIVDAVAEKQSPSVIARLLKQIKLPGGPKTDQELTLVADQLIAAPKITTPTAQLQQWAKQGGYIDPKTNKWVKFEGTLAADHVYPKDLIKKLPGYDKLTREQQEFLLNYPGNFEPFPTAWNSSKKNLLADEWAKTPMGKTASKEFLDALRDRQQAFESFAKEMISFWTKK